jgi:hypothetical protein
MIAVLRSSVTSSVPPTRSISAMNRFVSATVASQVGLGLAPGGRAEVRRARTYDRGAPQTAMLYVVHA